MVLLLVGCVLVYSFGAVKHAFFVFFLTGYGIMTIAYYLATTIFAICNMRRTNKEALRSRSAAVATGGRQVPSVGVHVVGYREDPVYYRSCLESIKTLEYLNVGVIAIVVDGNEQEDMYMADIARDVFGSSVTASVNLTTDPRENDGYNAILSDVEQGANSSRLQVSLDAIVLGFPKEKPSRLPHTGGRYPPYHTTRWHATMKSHLVIWSWKQLGKVQKPQGQHKVKNTNFVNVLRKYNHSSFTRCCRRSTIIHHLPRTFPKERYIDPHTNIFGPYTSDSLPRPRNSRNISTLRHPFNRKAYRPSVHRHTIAVDSTSSSI